MSGVYVESLSDVGRIFMGIHITFFFSFFFWFITRYPSLGRKLIGLVSLAFVRTQQPQDTTTPSFSCCRKMLLALSVGSISCRRRRSSINGSSSRFNGSTSSSGGSSCGSGHDYRNQNVLVS